MKKYTIALALFALPAITFAQFGEIDTFIGKVSTFINSVLIPFVFAAALLMFVYGMYKYFIYQGAVSEVEKESGKDLMIYAVIGFVLMVSIWGIVNLVASGLFTGIGGNAPVPTLPGIPTL
jgi:hypothetical protein